MYAVAQRQQAHFPKRTALMSEVDFMSVLHKSTNRDYLARVNDSDFPKARAAELAKKFAFDYWDGDRRICYGGYRYLEGRWGKSSACNG